MSFPLAFLSFGIAYLDELTSHPSLIVSYEKMTSTQRFALLALGRAWILFGSRKTRSQKNA